jgi:hypothetical protein
MISCIALQYNRPKWAIMGEGRCKLVRATASVAHSPVWPIRPWGTLACSKRCFLFFTFLNSNKVVSIS